MNPFALAFFLCCAIALLTVQRRWAPVPLLVGCCYMTIAQGIELGAFSLPVYRMLLLVGLVRIVIKKEGLVDFGNLVDKLIFFLIGWIILAGFFRDPNFGGGPVYASGVAFNLSVVYFLIRAWCRDLEDIVGIVVITAFLLAPIALEMLMERQSGKNLFSVFGGVPAEVMLREGKLRAQGPFRHPILAGTVGAVCTPLFIGIWRRSRLASMVGITSGVIITFMSASSGPLMSLIAAIFAVIMWRFRHFTRHARIVAIAGYFALQLYTGEPGYYVMKRIDLSGGSTGWHRARLIESAFEKLDEWWLFGTDVTRHWMPTGVSFSPHHTDITNYYLGFGVIAGLPAMLAVVMILFVCFVWVGKYCRLAEATRYESYSFLVWCIGSGLFAHSMTSVSVSYFDQSLVFFWMNVAIIASVHACILGYMARPPVLEDGESQQHQSFQKESDCIGN